MAKDLIKQGILPDVKVIMNVGFSEKKKDWFERQI